MLEGWMAGIVDGEGCLTISKQIRKGRPSPAFRVMITISNTDLRLLAPFKEKWGGGIYHSIDSRVHKRWKDAWTWHCPQRSEIAFLSAIMPHLRGKKRQAEVILRFIALKRSFKRTHVGVGGKRSLKGSLPLGDGEIFARTQIWNEVRALNSKGSYSRKLKGGDAHAAH